MPIDRSYNSKPYIAKATIARSGIYHLGANNLGKNWGLAQDELKRFQMPESVLKKAAPLFEGLPVIVGHKDVSEIVADPDRHICGICTGAWYDEPHLKSYLELWSHDAIAGIRSGRRRQISFGFDSMDDRRPTHAYDARCREIMPLYIALVSEGAGGRECGVFT